MMDKYDLTQEQWDAMVTARLEETEKALDAGTAVHVPYKEMRARLMKRIEEIAEKEHEKAASSYQFSHSYEQDSVIV